MNPGSETLHVRLQRSGQQPWGFRLQGGADFSVPLSIQLVNPGSLAQQYNVHPGDAVLAINGKDTATLDHEAAKYEILMAQSELNLVLQRGAVNIWKPKVTPLSELKPSEIRQIPGTEGEVYVQRTSLAADKREPLKIGTYNRTARPFAGFGAESTGAAPPAPAASQPYGGPQYGAPPAQQPAYGAPPAPAQSYQYGGPSQDQYNAYQSQQMAAQHQAGGYGGGYGDNPTVVPTQAAPAYAAPPPPQQPQAAQPPPQPQGGAVPGIRSVRAPVTKPPSERPQQQHPTCGVCGGLIVGVFVRISGEPLHPECFKCTRCGKNLKNQGHFTIEGKRYCDTCAEQVAEPPGPDMVATPVYR